MVHLGWVPNASVDGSLMVARRFALNEIVAVRVLNSDMPDFAAMCLNVSASGILLSTPCSIPEGLPVELWMMMPAAEAAAVFPIRYTGRVVRTEWGSEGARAAVAFTSVEILQNEVTALALGPV